MSQKTDLADAYVLLRCSQSDHKNCTALQELLINNFINIVDSSLVETSPEKKYCVMVKVKINPEKISLFERRLRQIKSEDNVRVADFHIETVLS